MKTRVILPLFLLLATVMPIFAQEKCDNRSRAEMHREFRDFKIKYIAQEIDLPADKFKEFSELYGQMEEEKHKVFSSTRRLEKSVKNNANSTEEDYARLNDAMVSAKAKDAEISKRYEEKFAKLLTPKQRYKLKDAEESFRKKMQEMRRKKLRQKKAGK